MTDHWLSLANNKVSYALIICQCLIATLINNKTT